jgi:formylglycine-generating enzyme required for sulfatase activity
MKWTCPFQNCFIVSHPRNFISPFTVFMRAIIFTFLILSFFISCSKDSVEQIKVKIPKDVIVPTEMVYIPEGDFIMGDADEKQTAKGEKTFLPAYLIDRFKTSRSEYAEFNSNYHFAENKGDFPATQLNYFDAESYCQFRGKRLPTETEWEKAARGTDGRKWPWLVYYKHPNDGFSGFIPEPVAKRGDWIGPYGLYGTGHNVWEWTSDWYDYPGMPKGKHKKHKVIRGGLLQTHTMIRFSPTWYRNFQYPNNRFNFVGVRCARDITLNP